MFVESKIFSRVEFETKATTALPARKTTTIRPTVTILPLTTPKTNKQQ